MKNKILILTVITLMFSLIYLIADSKLYYYGESAHNIFKKSLPLGLKPDFLGSDVSYPIIGFTITNKYGLSILGKDVNYNIGENTIMVEEVIKYGFNDTTLVALIKGKHNTVYYIKFASDTHGNLNSKVLNGQDSEVTDTLNWITLKESSSINALRAGVVAVYIILLILIPIGSYIIKKSKGIKKE
jgi:hypothetical protein